MKHILSIISLLFFSLSANAFAENDDFMAQLVGQSFFRALFAGSLESLTPLCASSINFDGQIISGKEAIDRRLQQLIKQVRNNRLQLKKITILSYKEMIQRFGPPPIRLRSSIGPGRIIALGKFNTLGAIAVLKRQGHFWRVIALSD